MSHNDIVRGPLANTLALHDFQVEIPDVKGWFYYVESWMLEHGLTPTKMGGKGDKNITFSRGKKQQEKENFAGLRTGMWIAALPPDERVNTEMFDFIFDANLRISLDGKSTVCLCWDDQIVGFNQGYVEGLAKDLYAFFKPAYGYAYQRPFKLKPSFYPFGFLGGVDFMSAEAHHITQWAIEYFRDDGDYRRGMFRDIYPYNFLHSKHFDIEVAGQGLKDWILSSPDHGTLQEIAPNFWSWSIEEGHIEAVREALMPSGMLIAYIK